MASSRPKVMIATPCYGGMVHAFYAESLLRTVQELGNEMTIVPKLVCGDSLVSRARTGLFAQFNADKSFTHLLFIDADEHWSPGLVKSLVQSKHEMCGGVYPLKLTDWGNVKRVVKENPNITEEDLQWASVRFVMNPIDRPSEMDSDGFIEVSNIGTGFLCISRAAADKLVEAYSHLKCVSEMDMYAPYNDYMYDVFGCYIEEGKGLLLSEDFAFCKRWRNIGGKVYAQSIFPIGHTGNTTYTGSLYKSLARKWFTWRRPKSTSGQNGK